MQTSSLGVIAASSLSINCQNNLNTERQGSYMGDFADKPNDNIRAAFIGINRGSTHLKNFATIPGTEVVALCDLYEDIVQRELNKLKTYNANYSIIFDDRDNSFDPSSGKIISFSIDKTVPDTTEPSILVIS